MGKICAASLKDAFSFDEESLPREFGVYHGLSLKSDIKYFTNLPGISK
jgi:hypothetical protein